MNWWLIVVACIASLLLMAMSVYIVLIYVAENDRDTAWFPKGVVVFGFTLACVIVLMLPFDVANGATTSTFTNLYGGGLDTQLMWQIALYSAGFFAIVVIPFAMFFYEAYDPDHHVAQQFPPAILYTSLIVAVFVGLSVILWLFAGEATISYYSYSTDAQWHGPFDVATVYQQRRSSESLTLTVSYFVYVVALLATIGWLLFIVYGGVGIVSLPIDMFYDWIRRPKPMPLTHYNAEKERIALRAGQLLQTGKQLDRDQRSRASNAVRRRVNAFHNEVLHLQVEMLQLEEAFKGGWGIIKTTAWMIGAVGALGLSILWGMHVLLYNLLNLTPFLNDALRTLDEAFALLGTLAYGALAFYLLLCAVKGCIKVGMRIVFFQIHPMRLGDTLMNSMLFNTGLVLLTAITVTQFCAQSFDEYAANTAVDALLNVYVRRLKWLGLVIGYFPYVLLLFGLLSIMWVILCPRTKVKHKVARDDGEEVDVS